MATDISHGGSFAPEIWSKNLLKEYMKQTAMSAMMEGEAYEKPATCPLSKEIALDAIRDLTILRPDIHLVEILRDVLMEGVDQQDTAFAEQLTKMTRNEPEA